MSDRSVAVLDRERAVITEIAASGYRFDVVADEASLSSAAPLSDALIIVIDGLVDVPAIVARLSRHSLPIILMASEGNEAVMEQALDAGAADFLRFADRQGALLQRVLDRNIGLARYQVEREQVEARMIRLNEKLQDTVRILERDQRAGYRVQSMILPPTPQRLGGIDFGHSIHPSLILSGDFIDYFMLPDGRILFYLADVSGHGTSSAFVTILLKSLVRKLQHGEVGVAPVGELLGWLNRELLFCQMEHHVALFLGLIDPRTGTLSYANAALFPPPVCYLDEEPVFLNLGKLPLGLSEGAEYDSCSLNLGNSFGIAVFSDGVLEILAEDTTADRESRLLSLVNYAVMSGALEPAQLALQLGLDSRKSLPDDIALLTVTSANLNEASGLDG